MTILVVFKQLEIFLFFYFFFVKLCLNSFLLSHV